MAGGLLQLAAYGSENQYIHGNPQITFFKIVYKRHTNFAMEAITVNLEGPDELSFGDTIRLKCKIPRNGDLIAHMYFRFKIPDSASNDVDKFYWTRSLGLSMIDYVHIYIGGQKIETLYGQYLDITNQLTVPKAKQSVFNNMVGDSSFMSYLASYKSGYYPGFDFDKSETEDTYHVGCSIPNYHDADTKYIKKFYNSPAGVFERHFNIPLNFWFVRNPGLALPLVALQYHDVELEIQLKAAKDLYTVLVDDKKYYYYEDEKNLNSGTKKETDTANFSHYTTKGPIYNVILSVAKSVDKDDAVRQTKADGSLAQGKIRFSSTGSVTNIEVVSTNGVDFDDQPVYIDDSTLSTPLSITGTPVKNINGLSKLPGTAGSLTRIRYARELAANRRDSKGNKNKGLKCWIPKLRIKPIITKKEHHISNFLYGNYVDKTWDFQPSLDINYIFLDNDERRVFAEISHQYLIEQVIRVRKSGLQGKTSVELEAYHPVKEILFTATRDDNNRRNEWLNYTTRPTEGGGGSAYDYQDHWWHHSCDVAKGLTGELIKFEGPITFTHPDPDGDGIPRDIVCDRFQELLFRFGPNGEAGDTALDVNDSILGFVIQSRHSLYKLSVFKTITERSWLFTESSKIPKIDNDDYEVYRTNPLVNARLKFNGQVRQEEHRHEFYTQVQAYQHHTANPAQPIYLYSFALNPEKYQPSGACNMSRIKSIIFDLELKDTPISDEQVVSEKKFGSGINITREWLYHVDFYVVGYNILKIMGGLGGLVFGN